jgi:hypothetical protein
MGEGLVSEWTTLVGVFEGRKRDWSGWGRDWSQNGLVLEEVCWRVAAGTGQDGVGTGLRMD